MKAKIFTFVRGLKNGTPPRFQSYLKSLTLLLGLVLSVNAWGEEITLTAGTDKADTPPLTKGCITLNCSTVNRDDNYRANSGTTMTISTSSGNITKIVFNCNANNTTKGGPGCMSINTGGPGNYSYNNKVGTWEGEASSITFTTSAQVQMNSIVVTVKSGNQIKITASSISGFAGSYSERTWTANDVSGKCYAYRAGSSEPYLMQFNSTPYIYNTVAVPGYIKSIKIVKGGTMDDRSWSVYCSTSQISESSGKVGGTQIGSSQTVGTAGYTWNVDTENKYTYFYIKKGSSATQISEFVITYEDAPPQTEITLTANSNGSVKAYSNTECTTEIQITNNKFSVDQNSTVYFKATPNTGYVIDSWTGAGVTVNPSDNTKASLAVGTASTKEVSVSFKISKTLTSIAVTTQPSKKNYTTCETLDLTGCVVTAYYSDANPEDVTKDCTFTPADGAALTTTSVTSVAVSYGGKETSINDIVVTEGASDMYVDNVHNSVISGDFSCSYQAPSLEDKQKGATESCEDTHYHFVGWVEDDTAPIQSPSNVIPAGTNMTGYNKTYKAVWAKEAE